MKASILYEILERIKVRNWDMGDISALTAWSTGATMSASDARKVRRTLRTHGYKCSIVGGIILRIEENKL